MANVIGVPRDAEGGAPGDEQQHAGSGTGLGEQDDGQRKRRAIALLRERARELEREVERRRQLEQELRDALEQRAQVERDLRESLAREAAAREQAEASDAFKQMFLAVLGHDLRNPLSTILTTARIMMMGDLPADDRKRLQRMLSSGERMRRMVDQILDVTHARLATGIPIERSDRHDLTRLVARIVDEARAGHPERAIELAAGEAVIAGIDPGRIEQVVSNLVDNALTHGDPERPIRVVLERRGACAVLRVQNHGTPIDAARAALLFDPFERDGRPLGKSAGLGLGLYISRCIVAAHGGTLEVESCAQSGTCFEVMLPLS